MKKGLKQLLEITDLVLENVWKFSCQIFRLIIKLLILICHSVHRTWKEAGEIRFIQKVYDPLDNVFSVIGRTVGEPTKSLLERISWLVEKIADYISESKISRRCLFVLLVLAILLFLYPPTRWGPWYEYQKGVASYYGGKDFGNLTANGEIFTPGTMTAAHKNLPFNTTVFLVNNKNGRSALVRINDDGPNVPGRIIDVNKCVARKLGFLKDGLTDVTIYTRREFKPGKKYRGKWAKD